MTFHRLAMLGVVIPVIFLANCNGTPPHFESGIRWGAFLVMANDPSDLVPLGGAYDSGAWQYAMSGITHGTQKGFGGSTRLTDGYDDHPSAEDNSVWFLYMDFSFSEPDCPPVGPGLGNPPEPPKGAVVPDGGGVFQAICEL
jgi:hypothetical protein